MDAGAAGTRSSPFRAGGSLGSGLAGPGPFGGRLRSASPSRRALAIDMRRIASLLRDPAGALGCGESMNNSICSSPNSAWEPGDRGAAPVMGGHGGHGGHGTGNGNGRAASLSRTVMQNQFTALAERINAGVTMLQRQCETDRRRLAQLEKKFEAKVDAEKPDGRERWAEVQGSVSGLLEETQALARRLDGLDERLWARTSGSEASKQRNRELEQQVQALEQQNRLAAAAAEELQKRQATKLRRTEHSLEEVLRRVSTLEDEVRQRSAPHRDGYLEAKYIAMEQNQEALDAELRALQANLEDGLQQLRDEFTNCGQEGTDLHSNDVFEVVRKADVGLSALERKVTGQVEDVSSTVASLRVKVDGVLSRVSGLAERIETAHEPSIDSLRMEMSQERREFEAEVQALKHRLQQVQDSNDESCSELRETLRQARAETAALSCRPDMQEDNSWMRSTEERLANYEQDLFDLRERLEELTQGDLDGKTVTIKPNEEIISLTPSNAMKGTSSFNESRKNQSFYGWPETVAQWVEVLLGGLNSGPMPSGPAGKSFCSDHRSYVLYGQPVYLFGLLLCVFCPAYLLKHIRDFGMAEKPMDSRIKSGAKGAVACRFVLWDRSFCFLNCHLAATTSNSARISARDLRQRLRQLEQCWTEIKFKSHVNQMVYPVSAHRAIFLLGDTNMRLVHKSDINEDFGSYATKTISAKENGYRQLWSLDQLCQELGPEPQPSLREHKIRGLGLNVTDEQFLSQWQEPFVSGRQGPPFPPTFKLAVPGPGYSKKRVPAWTDRVLYSSDHAEPLKYGSLQQSQVLSPPHNVSDHDPVYAFFDVECMGIDPRRLGLLARQVRGESRETRRLSSRLTTSGRMQSQVLQAQALEEDALGPQTEIDDASRKLFEQVTTLQDSSETALACLMLQECQQECWKLLCSQLEQKLGCSIRHIQTSQSTGGHEMADEEAEEVVRKLDSEALQEGLREVLQSMQRGDDWQCNRVLSGAAQTLLERRSHGLLRKKSSDNSLLSL